MRTMIKGRLALALVAGAACLLAGEPAAVTGSASFVTQANAVIGRPLTPLSYAGVARRTTRRAVAGAAVVGGAVVVAPAPVVVTPACVQAVDAYGRIYMRCY
jgi:hypothetical protein